MPYSNALRAVLFAVLAFSAVSAGLSQSKPKTQTAKPPAEVSGKQIYKSYCASCHGEDAKGDGPAAPALKVQPPDLTLLSKNNGGKFPEGHLSAVLVNGVHEVIHGSAEMPVWGPFFSGINDQRLVVVRIKNLTLYVESLQQK